VASASETLNDSEILWKANQGCSTELYAEL